MPEIRPTASEIVLVHALRFCEPSVRGVAAPGAAAPVGARALGRALIAAAIVSARHERWLELGHTDVPVLMGLASRRELTAIPGQHADDVPPNAIEARLVATIVMRLHEPCWPLARVIRHALALPGDPRPNPIELVRSGARIRGLLVDDRIAEVPGLDSAAADRIQSLLADLREQEPELWRAIDRAIDDAFAPWMPRSVRGLEPAVLPRPRRDRREAKEYGLDDWRRLNRNPPKA